jgi:hypothetical protein
MPQKTEKKNSSQNMKSNPRKGDPSTTRKKLQGTTTPKHSSLKESEFNQPTTTAAASISNVFHFFRI